VFVVIFFFQAEDGIRDFHVTGVQTCALPIWLRPVRAPRFETEKDPNPTRATRSPLLRASLVDSMKASRAFFASALVSPDFAEIRSEERRVGKECRCRWPTEY